MYQPAANPVLEQAILADLDNPAPYLVYADWLAERGDPRGQLITLQAQGRDRQARALLASHHPYFYGPLRNLAGARGILTADWHFGFIRAARLSTPQISRRDRQGQERLLERLGALLTLPSARFLRELSLEPQGEISAVCYERLVALLVKHAPPSLRRLDLCGCRYTISERDPLHRGALAPIWAAFPQVTDLGLRTWAMDLGEIRAPELRRFAAVLGERPGHVVLAITRAEWPRLERLHLELEHPVALVGWIRPILDAVGLPALRELAITGAEVNALPLVHAISESKLLPQLHTLDLSGRAPAHDAARLLVNHPAPFAHLERLILRGTRLR